MEAKNKILILDDEPIVGERLKISLERAGFVVEALSSSVEAINRLKEAHFDILVTDLKMSGPDGLEVLRIAREVHRRGGPSERRRWFYRQTIQDEPVERTINIACGRGVV